MPKIGDTIPYNMEAALNKLVAKHNRNQRTAGMSDAEYAKFLRREKAATKAAKKAEE